MNHFITGEKNEQLKHELASLACHPYNTATKEVRSITKQLIDSQKMVQSVSASLRKVSKELFMLEDTIDAIRCNKNLLITDFINEINRETEVEESSTSMDSPFNPQSH